MNEYEERMRLLKVVWMNGSYNKESIMKAIEIYKMSCGGECYRELVSRIEKTCKNYESWKRNWGIHSKAWVKSHKQEAKKIREALKSSSCR